MVGSAEELYHAMENASVDLVINDQWLAFSDTYHNEVLAESKIYIRIIPDTILKPFSRCSDHAFKIANTSRHLSCFHVCHSSLHRKVSIRHIFTPYCQNLLPGTLASGSF